MALESPTAPASLSTSVESSAPRWKYEVYLSFMGKDTRRGFTSYLYNELQNREIKTSMDIDETSLDRGEGISQSILEAIQESRFAIVVLSQNYASSSWCLDELTQIMQCMENKETILPVFYHVDPSEVRSQRGVYGAAFAAHEERFKDQKERLMKWRDALNKISSIFGWVCGSSEPEGHLVQQIAEFVCSKPIEIESTEDIETKQAMNGTSPRWKYDVFINFRGEDTCKGFVSYLLAELQKRPAHLNIVKNDEPLPKGRNISSYLLNAIEEVRFAIVVLSQDFAYSSWCLEELAKIFECMGNQNRILPIFYHVDPSEVRHQRGSFEDAFAVHEERFRDNPEKVRRWRNVLSMVANLSGWNSESYKDDGELIKDVVQAMCSRLVQSTESTEDSEAPGDVMDRTSPQPDPASVWKNDELSGFGMEDTRRGSVAHSDHELQNTGLSKTFKDEDQLEEGVALPSTSLSSTEPSPHPALGQKNDEFLGFRENDIQRGFVTHLGHEIQNTRVTKTFTDEDHLEKDIAVPSSSPPSSAERDPRPKYDVFLSFRGEDTGKGFVAHLYRELQRTRVIKTFKDDVQLEKGTVIASNLLTAIEESRFAIIVLSKNYASSSWCLDELAKIFQCMKDRNTIFPIFYEVEPTDVRRQKIETSFGKAFIKQHETHGQDNEKMKQWSAALEGVAGIAGFPSNKYTTDIELIKDIVKHLLKKVLQAPTINFETFEATRQAMDEVMKVLKDDQVTVLGVHGVAGIGKTMMVKHVGAQSKKDGLFDHVIMVVVSKNPDLEEIQGTLAESLGLKEGIMRGNRILIILDDIWESLELSSIGIPSHNELQRCNSKVILTTRKSNVCDSMGCHAQIPLNVLSEEDSWKLFMKTSGKSFHESTVSYDEARKVAGECGGLPKAIKAAARSLGDKYLDEWNEAVETAFGDDFLDEWNETAHPVNFEAEEDIFHSLATDEARLCFLLCCLFPENYDIPIEELLKYGIGIGLFQYDTMQEARDRAHSVVKYIKASALLLDGTKKGCVRMPDDIPNLAMSIVWSEEGDGFLVKAGLSEEGDGFLVKAGCELEEWPEAETEAGWLQEITSWIWNWIIDPHEGYSMISLMRNKLHKLPEYLVCSKLRILLLQSNAGICDIPETFFQSPNGLRVFDLSFTSVSSLPSSFSFLTNLRTLNLDFCKNLSNISVLGKIKKLEILSMRELPLKKFPKQIGDLTSLRMLDVTGGNLETIPSKVISRLYRLEELHMKCQFGKWGSKIEDAVDEETNADFDELTGLLDLNILEVYISDAACLPRSVEYKPNWVEFDICISSISRDVPCVLLPQHDGFSRTLTLDTTINRLPDWFISVVTEKVEKLEYTNCEDLNDIVGQYDHGRFLALKYLSVNGHHENLKEIINTTTRVSNKPVFENLEELHLYCLNSLKGLCVGELPPGSLRKLKFLKVQTCRSLVNALLPSKLLQRLQNLEEIICVNLEGMKYVFGSDEGLDPEKIFLRKLREMRLSALYELVSICNGPAPRVIFQNLKVLAICKCKELKNLFTIDVAECLFQLQDLSIECCPSLDRVIEASINSLNSKIKLPALKKLALIDLPVLTRFCTESGTIETACPSLEYLYMEKCLQFPYFAYHFDNKDQVEFNDKQHLSSIVKRWEEVLNRPL